MNEFKDRISEYPNRKRITVVSQNEAGTEIIADIERADGQITEEGSRVDAEKLNELAALYTNLQRKPTTSVEIGGEHQEIFDADEVAYKTELRQITDNSQKITNAKGGFCAGLSSNADIGGAVGQSATTAAGGAVGFSAASTTGGAVGQNCSAVDGFAGGYEAHASGAGSVQLGTGTNTGEQTLQFRNYQLVDREGHIPSRRLNNIWFRKTSKSFGKGSVYFEIMKTILFDPTNNKDIERFEITAYFLVSEVCEPNVTVTANISWTDLMSEFSTYYTKPVLSVTQGATSNKINDWTNSHTAWGEVNSGGLNISFRRGYSENNWSVNLRASFYIYDRKIN